MRVIYQDCGCIALPDEIVSALKLAPGNAIDISYDADWRVAVLAAVEPFDAAAENVVGASCRIRTFNP